MIDDERVASLVPQRNPIKRCALLYAVAMGQCTNPTDQKEGRISAGAHQAMLPCLSVLSVQPLPH